MSLYQIQLKVLGNLTSIADSQQVFGAICESYKQLYGSIKLDEFLHQIYEKKEKCAVSSLFLVDTLPMPLDIEASKIDISALSEADMIQIKKIKKIKFISVKLFKLYRENTKHFNETLIQNFRNKLIVYIPKHELICHQDEQSFFGEIDKKSLIMTRNKVSLDDDEKKLFYNPRLIFSKDTVFDVYLDTNSTRFDEIIKAIEQTKYLSFGGKQSIGMNLFMYQGHQEIKFASTDRKLLISLSSIADISYEDSYYQVELFEKKHINQIKSRRYRKQVILFKEGSVFSHLDASQIYGELILEDLDGKHIYQNAIGLFI
jgi:CRISPR type III-A-associated RAMP protein Csm4